MRLRLLLSMMLVSVTATALSATPAGATTGKWTAPSTPALSVTACYLACASPAIVRADFTLRATATDPDGGSITTRFQLHGPGLHEQVDQTGISGFPAVWHPATALADGAEYKWRARACDSTDCGSWSDWFVFHFDGTAPLRPTVSSTDYPNDGSFDHGGVGVPGEFTFGPSGATDVVEYIWLLGDGPATTVPATGADRTVTVEITPFRDGVVILTVLSRDAAGYISDNTTYQFIVKPEEPQRAYWPLDETGGLVANDSLGRFAGQLSGGVGWTAGRLNNAASFDGTGAITTADPVLSTARNFSIAAWVRAADLTADATAVSQNGISASSFALGYRAALGAWCFTIRIPGGAPDASACSTHAVAPGEWVHLVGVFDEVRDTATLYVNGIPLFGGDQVTVTAPSAVAESGLFVIGSGQAGGAPAGRWTGEIDEVHAYQKVLSQIEVHSLALP